MNFGFLESNPLLEYTIRVAVVLLIVLAGTTIARKTRENLRAIFIRAGLTDTFVTLFSTLAYYIIGFLLGALVLALIGVPLTAIAAILAGLLFILGIAFQQSAGNISAAVIILLFQPFKVGDEIKTNDLTGTVKEIQLFNTLLISLDNKVLVLPNRLIQNNPIINYSQLGVLRADMTFSIGYADDLQRAKQILEDVMATDERVLADPPATVFVENLGESSVDLSLRPYVNSADFRQVQSDLRERVKALFDEAGITMPYPQQDVHLFQAN